MKRLVIFLTFLLAVSSLGNYTLSMLTIEQKVIPAEQHNFVQKISFSSPGTCNAGIRKSSYRVVYET